MAAPDSEDRAGSLDERRLSLFPLRSESVEGVLAVVLAGGGKQGTEDANSKPSNIVRPEHAIRTTTQRWGAVVRSADRGMFIVTPDLGD